MQSSMLNPTYTDFSGINTLRAQAQVDPQASLKKVAKQFEGIFIQMMLKSMRDASFGDDIFDSDQSKLYRDMFDKQVALDMASSRGIGLAESLVRQLSKNIPTKTKSELYSIDETKKSSKTTYGRNLPPGRDLSIDEQLLDNISTDSNATTTPLSIEKIKFNSPKEFIEHILPFAKEAANELGVSPLVLVSQAALETGWGKSVIQHPDGSSSFNLFNIKADKRWQGEHVIKSTLEYDNGLAKYERASFRAYDSFAGSFNDYVDFLRTNSRYSSALQHQGDDELFIEDLHKAGYATDPNYANKIINIMNRNMIHEQAQINIDDRGSNNGRV